MAPTQEEVAEPRWFSCDGCVVAHAAHTEVFVGGTLVSSFDRGDEVQRNLLLVHLSKSPRIKKGKLAWAFGLTAQHVWSIRKQVERAGTQWLYHRPGRGRQEVVTPRLRKRILSAFAAGQGVREVHLGLLRSKTKSNHVSLRSISRVRSEWLAQPSLSAEPEAAGPAQALVLEPVEAVEVEAPQSAHPLAAVGAEEDGGTEELVACPLRGGQHVQQVGGWLLVSMVHALGLHAAVQQSWQAGQRLRERLRVALDAVVLALGLGQRCVEGVRRLRTPSGGVLLRADGVPTASWTRRILKHYLQARQQADRPADLPPGRGLQVQLRMMHSYLEAAAETSRGAHD